MAKDDDDDDRDDSTSSGSGRCQASVDEDDPHNDDYTHRNCPPTAPCQDD